MLLNPVAPLALCALLAAASAQSFFPCHPTKVSYNNDVTCTRVVLPKQLCKHCPLRPTGPDGRFEICSRIYDTEGSDCHAALQEYVDENSYCDPIRAAALPKMLDGDEDARKVLDYFLYSVCEQCCDCIPMGTEKADYMKFAPSHSGSTPTLWKEERGNCPAHAHFDVCKVLPHVTYFSRPGGPVQEAEKACPMLRKWQNSPEALNWEENPMTSIEPALEQFLRGMLDVSDCADFAIWGNCYDMENKQQHLDLPDDQEEPSVDPPTTQQPTTTDTSTTTSSTTTSSTATDDTSTSSTTTDASTSTTTTGTDASTSTTDSTSTTSTDATATTADGTTTSTTSTDTDTTTGSTTTTSTSGTETTGTTTTTTDTTGTDTTGTTTTTDTSTTTSTSTTTTESTAPTTSTGTATSSTPDGDAPTTPEATTPSPQTTSGGACFPESATVELESGEVITMAQVRIGDSVRVAKDTFSEVFLFSHRTSTMSASSYVQLATDVTNSTLTVTEGHYLRVNDGFVLAERVKRGDRLLTAEHGWASVSAVRAVEGKGLFNPHTVHGDIVVDGFVASTYTAAVPRRLAAGLLAPFRALYARGMVTESRFGSFLADGYRSLLPRAVEL